MSEEQTPESPSDISPPIHKFEVTGFERKEVEEEARKHLGPGERIVDLELIKEGRSGLWKMRKQPSVFQVTVAAEGTPAPYADRVQSSLENAIRVTGEGIGLACPVKDIPAGGIAGKETLKIAHEFLQEKGATSIDSKALKLALTSKDEGAYLVASNNGTVMAMKTARCVLVKIVPPGPGGKPVTEEKIFEATQDIPENILSAMYEPDLAGKRVSLAFSEEMYPVLIIWGDTGVGLRTLEGVVSENRQRMIDLMIQILDDCRVAAVDANEVKEVFSSPPTTERVVAPRDGSAVVKLSADAMQAHILVQPPNHGIPLTIERASSYLAETGVTAGVDDEALEQALAPKGWKKPWLVAEGKLPQDGEPGRWDLSFMKKHVNSGDDRVDYYSFFSQGNCEKDDVIARKVSATSGVPGFTVEGTSLPAKPGEDADMKAGTNTRMKGNDQIVSTIQGRPVLKKDTLEVNEVLEIDGNVDFGAGNIDFHGDVVVKGSVIDGFTVKSDNDIVVNKAVGNARLEAGGNIVVNAGIVGRSGAYIEVAGDLTVKFIESATVVCHGTITVHSSILHSRIYAKRIVAVEKRGSLVGGRIYARESVSAKVVGAPACTKTLIQIGGDPFLVFEREQLKDLEQKLHDALLDGEMEPDSKFKSFEERQENYQAKIEEIEGKIQELDKKIAESFQEPSGSLEVAQSYFPGVTVKIGPDSLTIPQSLGGFTIKKIDDLNMRLP